MVRTVSREWRNILVRAPNWVGDLVMATGSFRDLRKNFPRARIAILLPPSRVPILEGAEYYDRLIPDPGSSPAAILKLSGKLLRGNFDIALIYPNSFRTALVPFLGGIQERIGFCGDFIRCLLLTRIVGEPDPSWRPARPGPRLFPFPMAHRYSMLLEAIGAVSLDTRPSLQVSRNCEDRADRLRREMGIGPGEKLIGINPGASFGSSKLWPVDRFARLADLLSDRTGQRILILVGPGEEGIGRQIERGMREKPINTAGRPLDLDILKPFVRDLSLLVTTDTGTRHYAVAFQVPVVVVMGPTHPGFTAANLEETEVVRRDVPCGPCHLKTCPTDHRCMMLLEPEEVLERALALMERHPRRS